VERDPVLRKLEPDVEVLLVNRIANPPQYHWAPIGQCFRLWGIMRTNWRGLSGGTMFVRRSRFSFAELNATSGGHIA